MGPFGRVAGNHELAHRALQMFRRLGGWAEYYRVVQAGSCADAGLQAAGMHVWAKRVSGLRWLQAEETLLQGSVLLENTRLQDLVSVSPVLTVAEWRSAGVKGLHRCHRFEVNGTYFKPEACHTLSGAAPGSVVNDFPVVDFEFSARGRTNSKMCVRKARESRGVQANTGGYWKVNRIVGVRKLKSGGVMVEVEWSGSHGEEQIEEVRLAECSAALRIAAKALLSAPQVRAVVRPAPTSAATAGSRKSSRGWRNLLGCAGRCSRRAAMRRRWRLRREPLMMGWTSLRWTRVWLRLPSCPRACTGWKRCLRLEAGAAKGR